jgi:septum site-determining protein MinC
MHQQVQIKGTNNGFRIIITEDALLETVIETIDQWRNKNVAFFTSTVMDFIVIGRCFTREEKKALAVHLYNQFDVRSLSFGEKNKNLKNDRQVTGNMPLDVIERTIRSGEKIEKDGHIMVLGDVNPGGEVLAGGNIIVWGTLRGLAQAGKKQEHAFILAKKMIPIQLRIGKEIGVPPQNDEVSEYPEMAYLNNGQLAIRTILK